MMNTFNTTTPRTDAALAAVAKARETESDYKCHDPLIVSHVTLEMDYNGLRAENERLREALAELIRVWEGPRERAAVGFAAAIVQARAALGAAA